LDNVIDVNKYPLEGINEETKKTRRIGLGVMGLADALFKLNIAYNSDGGYEYMDWMAQTLTHESMMESCKLARDRGNYPLYNKDDFLTNFPIAVNEDLKYVRGLIAQYGIRNAWTTTVAPTGTLSMLAGCSSGIEPVFGLSFEKHVTVGKFHYANEIFRKAVKDYWTKASGTTSGFIDKYVDEKIERIVDNYGSCSGITGIHEDIQRVFVTAMDIHWADHVYAEAVWQRWISNAIAKTINMPGYATVDDVRRAYILAHELGLKGITVYRDGSRAEQVLHIASDNKERKFKVTPSQAVSQAVRALEVNQYIRSEIEQIFVEPERITVAPTMAGAVIQEWKPTIAGGLVGLECPLCSMPATREGGCLSCKSCGWSACSSA
jgi:ribonucleoside-diphosphate reductase alpha chain